VKLPVRGAQLQEQRLRERVEERVLVRTDGGERDPPVGQDAGGSVRLPRAQQARHRSLRAGVALAHRVVHDLGGPLDDLERPLEHDVEVAHLRLPLDEERAADGVVLDRQGIGRPLELGI
jgi:hypothetical protein